jgi:hypothetical protein
VDVQGAKGGNPPEVAVALSDANLSGDLDLGGIQAPLGRNNTPRYWESANVGQRASAWDGHRRCAITCVVKDERTGELKRETICYAYGRTAFIARARASLITRAVNEMLAKVAPVVLLVPYILLGVL